MKGENLSPKEEEFCRQYLVLRNGTRAAIGMVVAVDDHGAQQVLRLDDGMLIPFVEAIVQSVDVAARRIQADWAADWR